MPFSAARNLRPECSLASSIASRVSLVNLQKFTFQPWLDSAQHHDVRAGAEDPFLQAGDDDGVDLGVLEADALQGVGELDIDAEVVRIELQPVIGREPGVFADVHRQRGDRPVDGQCPMFVAIGMGFEGDRSGTARWAWNWAGRGTRQELNLNARSN